MPGTGWQIKSSVLGVFFTISVEKWKSVMSREKISQSEVTKALKGAAKAGFKVHRLERRADGFALVFEGPPPATVEEQLSDQNEWDSVK